MAKVTYTDPETGTTHEAGRVDTHIYTPEMIPSLKILTDPSRCDLDKDDPIDDAFLKSLVATGGNIEPVLARRDSSGQVWIYEGRRRFGGITLINSNPTYWSQFTPQQTPPIPPPPLPLQIRITRVTEEEALRLSLHGNNHKPLSSLDLAYAARNFAERLGWTQDKIAAEMGVHNSQISHLLRLLDLPHRVQKSLHHNKLKVSEAQQLLGHSAEVVDAAMDMLDKLDKGQGRHAIFAELKKAKRESKKRSTNGKKSLSRSLAEFKSDLEIVASSDDTNAANRATQLLDYLAGNESKTLAETLGGAS